MRATKKTSKKNIAGKIFFIPRKVFLSPEIESFFLEIDNNLMRALGRKNICLFGNARPNSNARAHLKQRKKNKVA